MKTATDVCFFDMLGRKTFQIKIKTPSYTINTNGFASGVYLIMFVSKEGVYNQKVYL
ncbi:T9SS type A sorting domain-containing protein [Tamlana sp. 2201CG12-4]|uniref:T9SS type A sorting domain-containing protein n=1 Tax=Tamlana sp. 2201CG12-4 TaxID=3112582 RepID=UPI003FA348E0